VEIERKFLLSGPPEDRDRFASSEIHQGYLAVAEDGTEVRVRERGGEATLTIKKGRGEVRTEEEIDLDPDEFARLWPLTEGRRVEKRRYLIPVGAGHTAELDVYEGDLAGLVTAEVEFGSEADAGAFEPPGWFGTEVTGDVRFNNQRLAVDGIPH
jgi:CYTH domain-containing protein